ncbi:Ig-like domain-containing protein [Parabacteroides chongii]|uniref:Ig-like domain-containing protein n=1 Tax=Parabacteroides chongii TaxID=2685834 RepID=UPI00240DAF85|nr:Ig-like domain-containing protein [Parabacteroides chongii]WFE85011.1 Ig-like domain-containing protein [Parabacteroides chongii]
MVLVEVKDSWKGTGEYIKSECLVTVEAGQAQSIELNHTESTLKIGDAISLTAKLIPDYATDDEIVWESSNPQIAAIKKKDDIFDKKHLLQL